MGAPIAVVGMGVAVPGASGPHQLWKLLGEDRTQFSAPTRFDLEAVYAGDPALADPARHRLGGYLHYFQPHPKLDAELASGRWSDADTETVWLRHCLYQALDTTTVGAAARIGVYTGLFPTGLLALEDTLVVSCTVDALTRHLPDGQRQEHAERIRNVLVSAYPLACDAPASVRGHAVMLRAMDGLVPDGADWLTLSAACASGLYAIDTGIRRLRSGSCDVALCGGLNGIVRTVALTHAQFEGVSAHRQLRAFDADGSGTVFSEGAAVVALKRLQDAERDGDTVFAVLTGSAVAGDGRGRDIAAPNPDGLRRAVGRAWQDAGIDAMDLDWVIGHGTGTFAGDSTELATLGSLAKAPLWCTSNKSLIGHTGWAAGVVSLIQACGALVQGVIPAQRQFSRPHPALAGTCLRVPTDEVAWLASENGVRRVGINGLGVGGANAHLVVQDRATSAAGTERRRAANRVVVCAWSAHLPGITTAGAMEAWIDGRGDGPNRHFGHVYPPPSFEATRLPPVTTSVIDRTHLLALDVAHRFVTEHGQIWEKRRQTAGVFCAQSGVTRGWQDLTLRAVTGELRLLPFAEDDRTRLDDFLQQIHERQHVTDDSFAGNEATIMANRVANRWDLHGPAMTIDTGDSSALAALRIAVDHLSAGDLDIALVLAVNEACSDQAPLLTDTAQPSEGAFLLALAREDTAREVGLPVLATLSCDNAPGSQVGRTGPDYGGAHGALDVIRALRSETRTELGAAAPRLCVTITPGETPGRSAEAPRRWATALRRADLPPGGSTPPPAPHLVLTNTSALRSHFNALLYDAPAVCTAPEESGGAPLAQLPGPVENPHVLVAADTRCPRGSSELLEGAVAALQDLGHHGGTAHVSLLVLDDLDALTKTAEAGLFTGFGRALAKELPIGRVRVVVTDGDADTGLSYLLDEYTHPCEQPVSYWRGGLRHVEVFCPAPLPPPARTPWALGDEPSVVAVGGGRGITAVVLKDLVTRCRPRLWIIGRSDPEALPATIREAREEDRERLRGQYVTDRVKTAPGLSAGQALREFEHWWNARESAATLADLRAMLGADRVTYLRCDVGDPEAVARAARQVIDEAGAPDLLLHAACHQQAARVTDKPLAAFRAGIRAKADGYRNLRTAFADAMPRRWVNFGSALGAVGFPGETDYCAANDYLAAAARIEQRLHGRPMVTVGWGLWEESGKVCAPEDREQLAALGIVRGMSNREGCDVLWAEIAASCSAEAAPIYATAAELGVTAQDVQDAEAGGPVALLGAPATGDRTSAVWSWLPPAQIVAAAEEHLVGGRPVVPGMLLVALGVEAASHLLPGRTIGAVREVRFEEPVTVERGWERPCRVVADVTQPGRKVRVRVLSDVVTRKGVLVRKDRMHAVMDVLAETPPPPAAQPVSRPVEAHGDPYTVPGAAVHLTGIFRNTDRLHSGPEHAHGLWRQLAPADDLTARARIPVLLLDALARLSVYPMDAPGLVTVKVPLGIAEIDVFTHLPDAQIAATWPTGVGLRRSFAPGQPDESTAVAPDGTVLARITGVIPHDMEQVRVPMFSQADATDRQEGSPTLQDTPPQQHDNRHARCPVVRPGIPTTGGLPYYETEHIVTFGEVSSSGFAYFAKYVEWMGECRERFGFEAFPEYMAACYAGTEFMLTVEASCEYLGELWVNDRAVIRMTAARADMTFMTGRFYIFRANPGEPEQLIARGEQTWASALPDPANPKTMHPAPWRLEVLERINAMGGDTSRALRPATDTDTETTVNNPALALSLGKFRRWASCFDHDREGIVTRDHLALAADRWGASAGLTGDHELTTALRENFRTLWEVGISPDGLYDKEGATYDQYARQLLAVATDPAHPFLETALAGLAVCFRIIDRDGDGQISEGEYTRTLRIALGAPEIHSIAAFQEADGDGDGRIGQEEFIGIVTGFLTGTDPEAAAVSMMGKPL
ncbi:SDR family oxidoreductase [Streptomyces sp. NPDC001719]